MKIPSSLEYWWRTAQIEPKRLAGQDTAVVFVHGLRSHSDQAFRLENGSELFFWDLLKDDFPLSNASFFTFNYGRIEIFHFTEGRSLEQTLANLCQQLHGAISTFRNVIIVGHSQGGLVAKMYACMYGGHISSEQSVLVITMHTPHRNRSMMVMRHTKNKQWLRDDRFFVPHLFCASYADNIVKPDNAIDSALDVAFTTHDDSFRSLGHSHLNKAPTADLIQRIRRKTAEFLSSGYSHPGIDINSFPKTNYPITIIRFSRSKRKIETLLSDEQIQPTLPGLETQNVYSYAMRCPVHVAKRFELMNSSGTERVEVLDLDNYLSSGIFDTVDWVCQEADASYSEILFDPIDFKKDVIVKNKDFFDLFAAELKESGQTLREQIINNSLHLTMEIFQQSLGKYWQEIVGDIYNSIQDSRKPKIITFKRVLEVSTRVCFNKKRFRKQKYLYQVFKREFWNVGWAVELASVDSMIAHLFRTDGEIYRLDRDIENIFYRLPLGRTK
ncbi:hypothetical protein PXK01_15360 [Phaeobacter sp. PT47_59]|uniref:esterase/lipase family protein n=1 Tax=Phaeobacter sp. PT47_59 TaxID=3029979 RepID=UPI0023805F63|nr:alpha/beta fold hydrolase [Phaeobacter sp. PT47_59]MDE4175539.1 hypothetical protein [Phaeobacter sp. PT47_59]